MIQLIATALQYSFWQSSDEPTRILSDIIRHHSVSNITTPFVVVICEHNK